MTRKGSDGAVGDMYDQTAPQESPDSRFPWELWGEAVHMIGLAADLVIGPLVAGPDVCGLVAAAGHHPRAC